MADELLHRLRVRAGIDRSETNVCRASCSVIRSSAAAAQHSCARCNALNGARVRANLLPQPAASSAYRLISFTLFDFVVGASPPGV